MFHIVFLWFTKTNKVRFLFLVVVFNNLKRELDSVLDSFSFTKEEIINLVSNVFGLTSQESRVYLVILVNDAVTARDISKLANIPRSRVYPVTDRLISLNLIEVRIGSNVRTFFASNPHVVIKKTREKFEQLFEQKLERLSHLEDILGKIWERKLLLNYSSSYLVGSLSSYEEMVSILPSLNKRLWIGIVGRGGVNPWPETSKYLIDALERGVDIRYYTNIKYVSEVLNRHLSRIRPGYKIQMFYTPNVPFNFILADDIVFLLLEYDDSFQFVKIINPDLVLGYQLLFEYLERNSEKLF